MQTKIIGNHINFEYYNPHREVFKDLDFEIDTSWKTAVVGRNGYGKSTLLKLIQGTLIPASGTLIKPKNTIFFPFDIKNTDEITLTVMKEIIAPFSRWELEMERLSGIGDETALTQYGEIEEMYRIEGGYWIDSAIEKELCLMDLNPSLLRQPFGTLSEGEKIRVQIVSLFLKKDHFPLLDEPTNHLDLVSREKLAEYLSQKPGFLFISHDRHFLDLCADHILSINKSDIRIHRCRYSEWKKAMDDEENFELNKQEKLKKEISALKESALAKRDWSSEKEKTKSKNKSGSDFIDKGYIGHRAAKLMQKALNIENNIDKKIEEKSGLLKNLETDYRIKIYFQDKIPNDLVTINNVSVTLDSRKILNDFSMRLQKGERIAIQGGNGSGKTTLFKVITGEIRPDQGTVYIPGSIRVQYARQNPVWNPEISLSDYLDHEKIELEPFRQILAILGVKGNVFAKYYNEFSEGEKKKIEIAKNLSNPVTLLLWDEPLNFLDIQARESIEEAILEFQPTLLFIEHDACFVNKIATQIIQL